MSNYSGFVVLVRHGQTPWNVERRVQGQGSISELNDVGREEARAKSLELKALMPVRLSSSPLVRAVQTANILADGLGLRSDHIRMAPRMAEFRFGSWEGQLTSTIEEQAVGDLHSRSGRNGHDGETMDEVTARALEELRELALDGEVTDVVVTHGGVIRMLMRALYQVNHLSMVVPNAAVLPLPKRGIRLLLGLEPQMTREILYYPRDLYKRGWYDELADDERDVWVRVVGDVILRLSLNPTDHRCCRMVLIAQGRDDPRKYFNVTQDKWPKLLYTWLQHIMSALATCGYHAQFQYAGNNSVGSRSDGLLICGVGMDGNSPEPNFPHIHILLRNFDSTVPFGAEFSLREGKQTREDFRDIVSEMRQKLRPKLDQIE